MAENGLTWLLCHGDELPNVWPKVMEFIKRAIDRADLPEFNLTQAYLDVASDAAELWVFHDKERVWGIVVAKHIIVNRFPIYDLYITAGDAFEKWADMIEVIEARARELGAKRLDISGRRGWLRAYRDVGFKELYTIIGKEL